MEEYRSSKKRSLPVFVAGLVFFGLATIYLDGLGATLLGGLLVLAGVVSIIGTFRLRIRVGADHVELRYLFQTFLIPAPFGVRVEQHTFMGSKVRNAVVEAGDQRRAVPLWMIDSGEEADLLARLGDAGRRRGGGA